MPTNHTTNYQLNQWVKSDQVKMEDFNADNAKIDAALAGLSSGKADKSALSSLQSVVDGKASTTALNGVQSTLNSKITGLQSTVTAQGTAVGKRNCAVYFNTYQGEGGDQITFDFPSKPWFVIIFRCNGKGYTAVRGRSELFLIGGDSLDSNAYFSWSGNSLTARSAGHLTFKETYTVFAILEL